MIGLDSIVSTGLSIIDKIIPNPKEREAAKLELLKQQQLGNLQEIQASLGAIIAEAQSPDKWTSRARPSFLYVMYILFLTAIPMGILFAFKPEIAEAVTLGVTNWLKALPEELYWLFGTGYLGYTGARSFDKVKR